MLELVKRMPLRRVPASVHSLHLSECIRLIPGLRIICLRMRKDHVEQLTFRNAIRHCMSVVANPVDVNSHGLLAIKQVVERFTRY